MLTKLENKVEVRKNFNRVGKYNKQPSRAKESAEFLAATLKAIGSDKTSLKC